MAIRQELDVTKFLARPEQTDVPPAMLLEQQQVATEVILKSIFPRYFATLLKVVQGGKPFPSESDTRFWKAEVESEEGGQLSVNMHALTGRESKELVVKGENVGLEVGRIYVFDGVDSIIFHLAGKDKVVYENGNLDDSETVLHDADSIFNPVAKRGTFRKGLYPAVWIKEMEDRNMIEQIDQQVGGGLLLK